ncbi:MAG: hypothetical protein QOI98_513, partial [Solirubrobacteraceae bacterium]|nr:hypothetical protein [Solirubrobacteraceae bacterium]
MRPLMSVPGLAVGLGTLSFATYLAATAPGAAGSDTQGAPVRITMHHQARYRGLVTVSGRLASGEAGHRLAVEFRPTGKDWTPLRGAVTSGGGAFRFAVRLRRSGDLRVRVDEPQAVSADNGGEPAAPQQSDA